MTPKLAGLRVAYLFVHDPGYPRNRLVREYLEKAGAIVDCFSVDSMGVRNPLSPTYIRKLIGFLSDYDVAVVSEFQLRYALATGIAAKLSGTRLIVDGFVGRHETAVGDWGQVSPYSLKALVYRAVDVSGLLVSDIYLIDNNFRAHKIQASFTMRLFRKRVAALPVGAPAWAIPYPGPGYGTTRGPLKVLYYGNYIPLHGVDVVLAGAAEYARSQSLELTLVGNGIERDKFELDAARLGIAEVCNFKDSVDEQDLRPLISASDVVLGVFGDSPKAKSVIANKVWQGLAMGKRVLTRDSPALAELSFVDPSQLLQIAPETEAVARALAEIAELKNDGRLTEFKQTHLSFQDYIDARFVSFIDLVKKEVIR
jgi:glycosyltransferase involved in cell wall biosynthesis